MQPYYQDGAATIYHGDCREVLPEMPMCDLVVTDPPYKLTAAGGGIGAQRSYMKSIEGKLDGGFDVGLLDRFPNWFCFCGKDQLPELLRAASSGRWMLLTWNKPNPTPLTNNNYLPDTEYIVHRFEPGRLFGDYADKSRFIVYPVEKNPYAHPTVKPLRIIEKCMNLGSQRGQTVLDPFMGTGTTLVAAKLLGRKGVGIEIEERWCETAAKRLRQEVLPLCG